MPSRNYRSEPVLFPEGYVTMVPESPIVRPKQVVVLLPPPPVWDLGFSVQCLVFRVRVQGLRFRDWGSGYRVRV